MSFRNILIENPAVLSVKNNQLNIASNGTTLTFPLEDINCVVIDNPAVSWSVSVSIELARNAASIVLCDQKHLPCSIITPFNQYHRQLQTFKRQISFSDARKNKCWQQIIVQKILNQSYVLSYNNEESAVSLSNLSRRVISGDKNNVEATAAAFYFRQLFGPSFYRSNEDDCRNKALNYGYSIIRSLICRTLSFYGFQPFLGLHHKSELNGFNLADDLIEPYRPFVDAFVKENIEIQADLTKETRSKMISVINLEVDINDKKYDITHSIDIMIQSLSRIISNSEDKLLLPIFKTLKIKNHE